MSTHETPRAGDIVTQWSGITLRTPGTLTRRDQVQVGDTVQSSHGIRFVVSEARTIGITTVLERAPEGSHHPHIERYDADSLIPVLSTAAQREALVRRATDLADADLRTRHALVELRRSRMDQATLATMLDRDMAWVQWFESYDGDLRLSDLRAYCLAIGARIDQVVEVAS